MPIDNLPIITNPTPGVLTFSSAPSPNQELARVSSDGEVFINWGLVEQAARQYNATAQMMLAIRNRTYKSVNSN